MIGKLQFSLRYLLVELVLFAAAMGLTRAVIVWPLIFSSRNVLYVELVTHLLCCVASAACWGAAFGGLFGNMKRGGRLAMYAVLGYLVLAVVRFTSFWL